MPEFDTPEPLAVTLEFAIGNVHIRAEKRLTTVVEVLPQDAGSDIDVRTAEQTQISCTRGALVVKGPRTRSPFGKSGTLDIRIELPAGSRIEAPSAWGMGDFVCEGPLGACALRTGTGTITVDRVHGDAEASGVGRMAFGEIAGRASLKNGNGETTVGEITGELSVKSSNGPVAVGTAHSGVEARSASGPIRVGGAARGVLALQTASGDVEVGIREGSAAWLDVRTMVGGVHNSLGTADGPGDAAETVEVRARTGVGNIVVRRP